ncbi:MAG TPA: acyl-CoA dehydrogenase [Crenotrichaceae bacterium]|nr:acyl-CoA dehydrogenase [Crenotrichaceae bacterium]
MLIFFTGLICLALTLAYFRIKLLFWSFSILIYFLAGSLLLTTIPTLFIVIACILVAVLGILNLAILRKRLISRPILRIFKKVLPPLSDTERQAMEAGEIWWDGELFSANPDWNLLLSTPKPQLTDEEQAFLDGPVQTLCERLDDWQITHHDKDLPKQIWDYLKREKFFGMIIPKAFGGLEFSALAHSSVVMKIASRSITAAVTVMVPNSLGPGALLLRYGTEEQKQHILPRLASGNEIPCFALTATEAGSDAGAMTDSGIVCRQDFNDEQNVLGIRLNWEKRYITLGPVATLLGLAFKLYDPDHLLGDQDEIGITLALIPTDMPGVTIGRRHLPIDIPFQNGPNSGKDVFIPIDWLIGGQEYAGQGWRMLMECLAEGRGVSLPALSAGAAKLASFTTGAYAAIRQQFHLPIGRFEGIQMPLGRIAGLSYLIDASRTLTLSALDQHIHPSVVTAMIKYHLTENMRILINDAMDIHGGKAIMMGPLNYLGRIYQSIPISITVEGANILTRNMMIFGQGAIRCHPYVFDEMKAAANPDQAQSLDQFDQLLFSHLGYFASNKARSLILGLTNARFAQSPRTGVTRRYYQQINRMSAVLALTSDVSMGLLGGQLKRRENTSARLGDVLSYLYLASAVLKRFEDQETAKQDEVLMHWSCQYCLYQLQESLFALYSNYPVPGVGALLRFAAFPTGRCFAMPSDALHQKTAQLIMTPGETRDRLCAGIFIPEQADQPIAQLQKTLELITASYSIEKRLRDAVKSGKVEVKQGDTLYESALSSGLFTESEIDQIQSAASARSEIIAVDDFSEEDI